MTIADSRLGVDGRSRLDRWARRWPVWLAIGLLVAWILVAGLSAAFWSLVSGDPITSDVSQLVGRLAGSCLVLVLLWRSGWLASAGVVRLGAVKGWIIALAALAYFVPADLLALFGTDGLSRLGPALADGFPQLWLDQASVGGAEELLFRGLLLAVLVTAWGRVGRGGLAAALGSALLFAAPHLIAIVEAEPALAILNVIAAGVSGFWYAAIVLSYGSIWPVALVHAATNLAVLSIPLSADPAGYLRLILVELPWLVFGIWLLVGWSPAPEPVAATHTAGKE